MFVLNVKAIPRFPGGQERQCGGANATKFIAQKALRTNFDRKTKTRKFSWITFTYPIYAKNDHFYPDGLHRTRILRAENRDRISRPERQHRQYVYGRCT